MFLWMRLTHGAAVPLLFQVIKDHPPVHNSRLDTLRVTFDSIFRSIYDYGGRLE